MQKQKNITLLTITLLICGTFLGMSTSTKNKQTDNLNQSNCGNTGPGKWDLGLGINDEQGIWQLGMLTQETISGFYGTYEESINCEAVYTAEKRQTLYDDQQKDAQAAYLAQRFGQEKIEQLNDVSAAALQVAFWKNAGVPAQTIENVLENLDPTTNVQTIETLAEQYFTEATQYAGPYSIEANINHTAGANVGQITFAIKQQSGNENTVPNIALTISVDQENTTADVEFTENNAKEITINSQTQEVSVDFTVFKGGKIFFNLDTEELPHRTPYTKKMSLPTKSFNNQQAIILTSIENYEPINDARNLSVTLNFDVNITTETSTVVAEKGQTIYDTLDVSLPNLQLWPNVPRTTDPVEIAIVSTLYGPLTEQPTLTSTIPVDTPNVGSVTTFVSATGQYDTAPILVAEPGFYTWVETIAAVDDGVNAWQGNFGIPEETSQVKWEIGISSDISNQVAVPGEQVADTFYQIGFPENYETDLFINAYMYFTPERPQETTDIPASATLFDTQQVPAGNGESVTPNFATFPDQQGCYTVVASFVGSETVAAYTSNFGIASETTCTESIVPVAELAQPVVVTNNSKNTLNPQDIVQDRLLVSGLPEDTQVAVVSTLYGPFSEKPVLQDTPPGDIPIVASVTTIVGNNGLHTTEAVQIPDAPHGSWFTWSEVIAETDTTLAWQGKFGIDAETSVLYVDGNETQIVETPVGFYPAPEDIATVSYSAPKDSGSLANTGARVGLLFLLVLVMTVLGVSYKVVSGKVR